MTSSDSKALEYLRSLKIGEHVIETGTNCFHGTTGIVYASKNPEHGLCVMWDLGDEGMMGTSITHGTRRCSDVLSERAAFLALLREAREELTDYVRFSKNAHGELRADHSYLCPAKRIDAILRKEPTA